MEGDSPPAVAQKRNSKFCKRMSALAFFLAIVAISVLCVVYYDAMLEVLNLVVVWIKANPFIATAAILVFYSIAVPLMLPVVLIQILLGFTYSAVLESQLKGLLVASLIV